MRRGESVAYFQNPRLLFQSYDLKNTFTRTSLQQVVDLFQDKVLTALDPTYVDICSCWLDIGIRDYISNPPSRNRAGAEPYTLLWKSYCNHYLYQQLQDLVPEAQLEV